MHGVLVVADDMRRADDAQRGIPPDAYEQGQESIMDASVLPSALGQVPNCYGAYNNIVVYFFAILALLQVLFWPIPFGLVAITIGAYRVHRHRPNARRGLLVAGVATVLGLVPVALALA
jgi:hypothetical protein